MLSVWGACGHHLRGHISLQPGAPPLHHPYKHPRRHKAGLLRRQEVPPGDQGTFPLFRLSVLSFRGLSGVGGGAEPWDKVRETLICKKKFQKSMGGKNIRH